MQTDEALKYPPHFPPTDRWKRFFLGVRWLGPDLSFLKRLGEIQGGRSSEVMNSWGGGDRQLVAIEVSSIFANRMGWPSPYFLPGDNVGVIVSGLVFGGGGVDDVDIMDAVGEIEERIGINPGAPFWQDSASGTLGELVDNLLRTRSGA
jgi:hypothetical protein